MKNKFMTFKINRFADRDAQLYNIVKTCRNYFINELTDKYQKRDWYVENVLIVECAKGFEDYDGLYCTVEFSGYEKLEELAATTGTPRPKRNAKKIPLYIKLGREIKFENVKFEN